MKSKYTSPNRLKTVNRLRLYLGWFGVLTPVFGAGVLAGVGLMGGLTGMFVGQVVFVCAVNYFVGWQFLKPVGVKKGVKRYA